MSTYWRNRFPGSLTESSHKGRTGNKAIGSHLLRMERENQKVQSGPGGTEHRKRQPSSVDRPSFSLHKERRRRKSEPGPPLVQLLPQWRY